jgi:hypothetical protein
VTIACGQCDRRGRLRVERLVAEHGADTDFLIVLRWATARTATPESASGVTRTAPTCRRCLAAWRNAQVRIVIPDRDSSVARL